MRKMLYSTIILSAVLLFSGIPYVQGSLPVPTSIILNQVPKSAYFGDELRISGQLIESVSREGVFNAKIKVVDNKPSGQEVLVTTTTRKYGLFTASWKAPIEDRDRTMHLIVKYDGSEGYTASIRDQTLMVKLMPLEVKFQYLQNVYKQGESVEIIFTVSSLQRPVEPDIIRTNFNAKPVTVTAYGMGNYVYETGPLQKGHNQFFVNVYKEGYKTVSRSITFTAT